MSHHLLTGTKTTQEREATALFRSIHILHTFPDSLTRIYWSLTSLCHLKSSLQVFQEAAARLGFPAASLAPPGGGKGEVTVGLANPRPVKEGRPAGCGLAFMSPKVLTGHRRRVSEIQCW